MFEPNILEGYIEVSYKSHIKKVGIGIEKEKPSYDKKIKMSNKVKKFFNAYEEKKYLFFQRFTLYRLFYILRYRTTQFERVLLILGLGGSVISGLCFPYLIYIWSIGLNNFMNKNLTVENYMTNMNSLDTLSENVLNDFVRYGAILLGGTFFSNACLPIVGHSLAKRYIFKYYKSIIIKDIPWFEKENSFFLTNRYQNKYMTISQGLGIKVGEIINLITMTIVSIVISFLVSWQLAIILVSIIPITISVTMICSRINVNIEKQKQEIAEKASSRVEEIVYGLKTVLSFSAIDYEKQRFRVYMNKFKEISNRFSLNLGFSIGLIIFLIYGANTVSILFGTFLVSYNIKNINSNDKFLSGDILTCLFCIIFSAISLNQLIPKVRFIFETSRECKILDEFEYSVRELEKKEQIFLFYNLNKNVFRRATFKFFIRFDNVSFVYPNNEHNQVLQKLSCSFEGGQITCIVGESGCGKSTIINLLEKFYPISEGKIYVNDRDFSQLDVDGWRNFLGYVPQDPILKDDTILENILYGRDNITEDEFNTAIKLSNCDEIIEKYGQTGDVGYAGSNLSYGEKQRICLARAIIKSPKILLLDEATSGLDPITDKKIMQSLRKIVQSRNTLVLIVTHKLSNTMYSDKIIVMKNGRSVEEGSHEELKGKNGFYVNLIVSNKIENISLEKSTDQSISQSKSSSNSNSNSQSSSNNSKSNSQSNILQDELDEKNQKNDEFEISNEPEVESEERRNSNPKIFFIDSVRKPMLEEENVNENNKTLKSINIKVHDPKLELSKLGKQKFNKTQIHDEKEKLNESRINKTDVNLSSPNKNMYELKSINDSDESSEGGEDEGIIEDDNKIEMKSVVENKKYDHILNLFDNDSRRKSSIISVKDKKPKVKYEKYQSKMLNVLFEEKFLVFIGIVSSFLNGLVWPFYGYLFSQAIYILSDTSSPTIYQDGINLGTLCAVLTFIGGISIGVQ